MTQHTDKFGRQWAFTPAHDTGRMLKIEPHIFQAAIAFQKVLRGVAPDINFCVETDCYLLKYELGGKVRWYSGVRMSDEPSDYYSSVLDDSVIDVIVAHHNLGWLPKPEREAHWELVGQIEFRNRIIAQAAERIAA